MGFGESQDSDNSQNQGEVEQVQSHMQNGERQREANGSDAPRAGHEQEQGLMQDVQDESREGKDQSEQSGREPGVQGQRGQQQGHGGVAQRSSIHLTRDIVVAGCLGPLQPQEKEDKGQSK